MNPLALKSNSAASTITTKQHVLLLVLTVLGSFLAMYFLQTRKITPTIKALTVELVNSRQQLSYLQNQLATREAMDLPAMRIAVEKAREKLRTVQLGGQLDGPPFIDSANQPKVAAFQSSISSCASAHRLFIKKHSAITETDPKLKDMIVRSIELRGRFSDLHQFVQALADLPYRVVVLSLEIAVDPQVPGRLNAVLRYSV